MGLREAYEHYTQVNRRFQTVYKLVRKLAKRSSKTISELSSDVQCERLMRRFTALRQAKRRAAKRLSVSAWSKTSLDYVKQGQPKAGQAPPLPPLEEEEKEVLPLQRAMAREVDKVTWDAIVEYCNTPTETMLRCTPSEKEDLVLFGKAAYIFLAQLVKRESPEGTRIMGTLRKNFPEHVICKLVDHINKARAVLEPAPVVAKPVPVVPVPPARPEQPKAWGRRAPSAPSNPRRDSSRRGAPAPSAPSARRANPAPKRAERRPARPGGGMERIILPNHDGFLVYDSEDDMKSTGIVPVFPDSVVFLFERKLSNLVGNALYEPQVLNRIESYIGSGLTSSSAEYLRDYVLVRRLDDWWKMIFHGLEHGLNISVHFSDLLWQYPAELDWTIRFKMILNHMDDHIYPGEFSSVALLHAEITGMFSLLGWNFQL